MPLRITVDLFSGRPNPVIELGGRAATDALERLRPAARLSTEEIAARPQPGLGYRGLIVEQVGGRGSRGLPRRFRVAGGELIGAGLRHRVADPEFEDYVVGASGPLGRATRGRKLGGLARDALERFRKRRWPRHWHPPHWPTRHRCACAPLYEPDWWNDGGTRQWGNNCYNYSCNYRSDTFAQPGLAAGQMYAALSCAEVRPAAVRDMLIAAPHHRNRCPEEGHLVALVIAPGYDFHWYRRGRNGYWSHKPGGTEATNLDNSGHLIPDPRTADRGPYTDFCTFMIVMHGHIRIA